MTATQATPPQAPVQHAYPLLAPRFWHGMRLGDYLALLWNNGFRVSPSRWHMAAITLPISCANTVLAWCQRLFYAVRIAATELPAPPLFIVGHFRTGTTHLYELLARDGRFIYPTTYACFAPTHFLLTESWIPRLISWMLPSQRPMDGMAAGLDHPQEDEFALIGLGGPTLYYRMAFPNQPPPHMSSLNCDHMSARDIARLAKKLRWLYRAIGVRKKGRLLVKSPAHTGRMPMLAEMFPGAQFIHIVRDPKAVLPSLRHTWRILDVTQGFQTPRPELDRDALIRETFDCMYDAFDHHIERLPPGSLCELRYEDLIQDPISELERVYRKLELGDFAAVRPAIEAYLGSLAEYRTNEIRPEAIRQPSERVRWYCERYGYDVS